MNIEERLKEIRERRDAIRKELEESESADVTALTTELRTLSDEAGQIEARKTALAELRVSGGAAATGEVINPIMENAGEHRKAGAGGPPVEIRAAYLANLQGISADTAETRAAEFAKEKRMEITTEALKRSITLATGGIAQPTRVSGITPGQNEVSGIVDLVYVVNAEGMGKDDVSYEISGADAETGKDGEAAHGSEPTFGTVEIKPTLINTISYVSKHIEKTTPLNYQARVATTSLNALRKKTGKMIVSGNPTATPIAEMCGIINAPAIKASSDITIKGIDATTLRKIALSYGGDENIEGGCLLMLNKRDLIAFGDVRGTNEKKAVYDISFAEDSTTTGTIKDGGLSVNFVINSECKALSDADTAANDYTMLFGKGMAYQLDLFGPYTVEVSRDYKFAEGLLAVLGEAMVGGTVIAHNGWIRVKKGA